MPEVTAPAAPKPSRRAKKETEKKSSDTDSSTDEFAIVANDSSTLPLHPSVYDVVKWEGDPVALRLHSPPDGSCAFFSLLRGCTGKVQADDVPHLRSQLKTCIAAIPAEQWDHPSPDFPTPQQYVDNFFRSTDAHVDRSVFQHILDADSPSILPHHLRPAVIFVITVQRCDPEADVEDEEVKVQSQNIPEVRVIVHKIVRRVRFPPSSPHCVVLYQMTGNAPHHFEAVTLDANGSNHMLSLGHPFIHALDAAASQRFIDEAYDKAFVCNALSGMAVSLLFG